jgi:hypothetical protein
MSNTTQSPDLLRISQDKYKQNDLIFEWKAEFSIRMKLLSKSTKQTFTFADAVNKNDFHTKRDLCFLETFRFLNKNPLQNNDYYKYVSCYIKEGKKLDLKYFRNNVDKLNDYYTKVDENKAKGIHYNPFNLVSYKNYVLYMVLKLRGQYIKSDDILFNVEYIDNREYNPLSKIPSVMRGELPFKVKEYDIKRAYPTFIDIELKTNYRDIVYDKIDKRTFAILLNSNRENPKNKIDSLQNQLSLVYGNDAEKVLTDERFNKKGKAFLDFSSYEKKYINQFVKKNELVNYVRLHDGIYVFYDIECINLKFDLVEFAVKECIKPPIENETINFYSFDAFGEVITSRVMYANFFIQEKFKRISTPDDKIQLLVDTNNVIDFFNHKTDIVSFLESNINECKQETELVKETIARECNSVIYQSYTLIPPTELKYYSDTKNSFGLPFKNGFFYFDDDTFEIKRKHYSEVEGFFSPHKIQTREFEYTDEIGMFEEFLVRAVLNADNDTIVNENDDNKLKTFFEFVKMIGYLCHSHKSQINNPCIILTDENANDENRNGRRGKTLIYKAINEVKTTMLKGGNEFDPGYTHVFADLYKKHKVYAIDDVPAGFKYDDLYTNILGGINCQRKGLTAELIPFEETPKFMITSNWVFRYDEKNASTNKRFLEYKFTNYYNQHHSPKDDFNCEFFTDWDYQEWNRFYSFIFKCVSNYIQFGINQISYDKKRDNYLVAFDNNSMSEEFERIIEDLINIRVSFSVNDFLKKYQEFENPMRNERFFNHKNVKKLIDTWFNEQIRQGKSLEWSYSPREKKWIK